MRGLSKKILFSITGSKDKDWKSKLAKIEKHKIKKIALFLEIFKKSQREEIYNALLSSHIKKIPLVHIRNEMTKPELEFLKKNFKTKCFTIHESSFKYLKKWDGFHKNLFLELNYDNCVPENVDVSKIGGFCIDLSHFKASEEKFSKDFLYTIGRRKTRRYFRCNHLNGYSYKKNRDVHTVMKLSEFNYLKTLPKFLFGKYIALEVNNPISQQIKFKEYVVNLLGQKLI